MSDSSLTECPICFENFNDDEIIPSSLPCGHTYCQNCLKELGKKAPPVHCPECDSHQAIACFRKPCPNYLLLKVMKVPMKKPSAASANKTLREELRRVLTSDRLKLLDMQNLIDDLEDDVRRKYKEIHDTEDTLKILDDMEFENGSLVAPSKSESASAKKTKTKDSSQTLRGWEEKSRPNTPCTPGPPSSPGYLPSSPSYSPAFPSNSPSSPPYSPSLPSYSPSSGSLHYD